MFRNERATAFRGCGNGHPTWDQQCVLDANPLPLFAVVLRTTVTTYNVDRVSIGDINAPFSVFLVSGSDIGTAERGHLLNYDLSMLNYDLPSHFPQKMGFEVDHNSTQFVQKKRVADHDSTQHWTMNYLVFSVILFRCFSQSLFFWFIFWLMFIYFSPFWPVSSLAYFSLFVM